MTDRKLPLFNVSESVQNMAMTKALCWIRRDLRLHDHAALSHALKEHDEVELVFVFDSTILDKLTEKTDARLSFIMQSLQEIERRLNKVGSSLRILYGDPIKEIPKAAKGFDAVYCNRDYEPYAKKRDATISESLTSQGIAFRTFKDAVIFEKSEVLNGSGEVYKVFTPYKNNWLATLRELENQLPDYKCPAKKLRQWQNPQCVLNVNWYEIIGFIETPPLLAGGSLEALGRLRKFAGPMADYQEARDIPSLDGTSNLSPYIRHGCLSVRDMVRAALEQNNPGAKIWLSEIVWRDFYHVILDAFPHVEKHSFKKEYDQIKWRGKKAWFEAWCEGSTGYPLVDAAMRCLNQTGMMHNRLRMVTASFLCKTLLIDWREGERYFAEKLLDYDMAANNGGWQWSSSTGCDAQPYFRIFNPYTQSEKFDSEGLFIREWIPELSHLSAKEIHRPHLEVAPDYPAPVVIYERMRVEALEMYAVIKK